MKLSLFLLLSGLVLLGGVCLAQAPPKPLPPDHPDLFHTFFLTPAVQQQTGVNAIDSPKIVALAQSAATRLNELSGQRQSYLARMQARRQNPHPATVQAFESNRYLRDIEGMQKLRRGVSPRGWQELRTYINGPFRDAVNAGTISIPR